MMDQTEMFAGILSRNEPNKNVSHLRPASIPLLTSHSGGRITDLSREPSDIYSSATTPKASNPCPAIDTVVNMKSPNNLPHLRSNCL